MIFQYILDKKRQRVGLLVGMLREDGKIGIGFSKVHKKDKFNKERGLLIAQNRIKLGSSIPVPTSFAKMTKRVKMTDISIVEAFMLRCKKYFNTQRIHPFRVLINNRGNGIIALLDEHGWVTLVGNIDPMKRYATLTDVLLDRSNLLY